MKKASYRTLLCWVVAALLSVVATGGQSEEAEDQVNVPYVEVVPTDEFDAEPDAVEPILATAQEEPQLTPPPGTDLWSQDPLWVDDNCIDQGYYSGPDLMDSEFCNVVTPYRWLVRADAIFLDRSTVDGEQSLAFGDPFDPKGTEVLHTGELDFSSRWGPRISLIRCLTDRRSIEVNYFNISDWDSRATRSGPISVQFPSFAHPPLPPGPFGTVNFDYGSQMHSFEANLRRVSWNEWLTWIGGFRYVELSEDFGAMFSTGGGLSQYTIATDNHLYGFQLGGEAHLWQRGNVSLDGWLKAAVLGNSGSQSTFEDVSAIGGGTGTASARGNGTSFLGELGVVASFQLWDRLALRTGYQAFWLDQVALAPEQLDNTNPSIPLATLDLSGDLFLHGGFIGLEALY